VPVATSAEPDDSEKQDYEGIIKIKK